MDESDYVHKKTSSEILFAEYGNLQDGEDPTAENKRVIDLMDPVDSMSLNREKTRVVVSGIRGVLQVVKIRNSSANDINEGPSIVKDIDMRVYRRAKVNILYSAQNVKWNQIYDQYIATTSSNGSIVCWNVARRNKSVYKAHERSATCLDWHATAPYILVSGSRDCSAKSYDLRVKDIHQLTFCDRNCESVRDIAFCKAPGFADYFFTGDDGGVLRLWDLRQTKRCIFENVAHRSFVSTLSLNPNNRTLIASGGGRDKMVKIWEWSGPELKRISVVETTAPLGRVAWRPDKPYQLATCASVNETTVHVWDVRRPFLPYVTYDEHRDSVTDACWPSNDCDVFMSCGKDGLIVLHNIDSGHAPINYACDVAFDITPDGCMSLAVNSEIHAKNDAALEERAMASKGKKIVKQIPYEMFEKPTKSLIAFGIPESLTYSLPPTTFYHVAEKYYIGGMEISRLCETNSEIARKSGLEHVAQTWRLVEALCGQSRIQEEYDQKTKEEKERLVRAWVVRKKELAEEGRRWLANLDDYYLDDVKKVVAERLENTQHVTAFLNFSSSSGSESDEDEPVRKKKKRKVTDKNGNVSEVEEEVPQKKTKSSKSSKKNVKSSTFFGPEESNFKNEDDDKEVLHHNEFVGLKNEAFTLRDEEKEAKFFCKAPRQPANAKEYEQEFSEIEAGFKAWNPMLEVYRLLLYHSEQGDMQTCATISMVCGKKLFEVVDSYTVNGWIQCYMEMLNSLELFMVCAKIRKYCPLDSISSVSRENTTIQLAHADCNAMIVNGRCTKCEKAVEADCTVCRFSIVGMMYQCNICGHAMHTDHAYEWFNKTTECAYSGCPCTCGKNNWPDMKRTFVSNEDEPRPHRKYNRSENDEDEKPSRVELSRPDSDSESDEASVHSDTEWSATTDTVRAKMGLEVRVDKPWEKYLKELYTARYKMPEHKEKVEDVPICPKSLEKYGKGLRAALELRTKQTDEEFQEILESAIGGTQSDEVMDRAILTGYYIDPEKKRIDDLKYEEENRRERIPRRMTSRRFPILEKIEEENENGDVAVKEEVICNETETETEIVEEKNEEEQEEGEGHNEEMEDEEEMNYWDDDKFGDEYIDSIGPIGLQSCQILERVTSPIQTEEELAQNLERVTMFAFGDSSESSEEEFFEQQKATSRDSRPRRSKSSEKKELTLKEKVLAVLNMSKEQMKSKREKKRRQKENDFISEINGTRYQILEYSSDEFAISSADDSVASSSSSSSKHYSISPVEDGYRAEDEYLSDASCSSTFQKDLMDQRETPQIEPSQSEGETKKISVKVKRFGKLSKSVCYSSGDEFQRTDAPEAIFIVHSASHFANDPQVASSESRDTCETPRPFVQVLPTKTPTPSLDDLRDSDASDSHPPIITPPLITSCTNPIFDKIARRPRSKPVDIYVNGKRKDSTESTSSAMINDAHSEPGNQFYINPLFRECTSLPVNHSVKANYSLVSDVSIAEQLTVENGYSSQREETPILKGITPEPSVFCPPTMPQKHEVNGFILPPPARISKSNQVKQLVQKQVIDVEDDDIFSSDEELRNLMNDCFNSSGSEDEFPFFPQDDGVYILPPRVVHPWETEEQYQTRLRNNQDTKEELQEATKSARLVAKEDRLPKQKLMTSKIAPQIKRVRFDEKDHEDALDAAIRRLKEMAKRDDIVARRKLIREKEKCLQCSHEIRRDEQLKQRVNWLRSISDETQVIYAQSFHDPCALFQLSYMDSYYSDLHKAEQDAQSYNEFIHLFYFINWDDVWRQKNDFMFKEMYAMFDNFRKSRRKVCDGHFKDFKFRFFVASIATKMKQELFMQESFSGRQKNLKYDWMHLKPCVTTLNDTPEALDQMMNTICGNHPHWTNEEKGIASQYWNIFGKVPLFISSVEKEKLPPVSEEKMEILDDTNYWTKKMLKNAACRSRNAQIKLTYTRVKKREEEINEQRESRKKLNREWKRRLDSFRNETPYFDADATAIGYDKKRNILHTDDHDYGFPICQLENKTHYITVRPFVTKGFIQFKGRLRGKFVFDRRARKRKVDPKSHLTYEDVRRTKAFQRFEPRLRRAEELQTELSKFFKVIDRHEVRRREVLYPILEDEEEDEHIIRRMQRRENRLLREKKDSAYLDKMEMMKYREQLADTEKLEREKMRVMNNHSRPQIRWRTRNARRVLEMGRMLHVEEVQKWMEFQYEMTFAKKVWKKKLVRMTSEDAKGSLPFEWHEAIDKENFNHTVCAPPYVGPKPKRPSYTTSFEAPFNSSSEEGTPPEPVAVDDYETRTDLHLVAALVQQHVEEEYDLADKDEDWEYSDDSSVSTWFENDTDDILNRLLNDDYNDEHFVLKERSKGALARPLWKVVEEKNWVDYESEDEQLDNAIDKIIDENNEEELAERLKWLNENGDDRDVGVPNDQRKARRLLWKEKEMDQKRWDIREQREAQAQQVRHAFKQFVLDRSDKPPGPFSWDPLLSEPISILHQCELRRVGNRVMKERKEEYINEQWMTDEISKCVPNPEINNDQFKFFNFLFYGYPEETFQESSKSAIEVSRTLKPLRMYEMFFGRMGVYKLKQLEEDILETRSIRNCVVYLTRRCGNGKHMTIPREKLVNLLRLWWCNSRDTLERFVTCCEQTSQIDDQLDRDISLFSQFTGRVEFIKETVDQLEIASIMNGMIHVVEQFVEEIAILFEEAVTDEERCAYSTMDVWDWNEMKCGRMDWYEEPASSDSEYEVAPSVRNYINSNLLNFTDNSIPSSRKGSGIVTKQMSEHYQAVFNSLKTYEEERLRREAEENVRKKLMLWDYYEQEKKWAEHDRDRRIHDFFTTSLMIEEGKERNKNVPPDWNGNTEDMLKVYESGDYEMVETSVYAEEGLDHDEVLQFLGIPASLDYQMFHVEMEQIQSGNATVKDADELAEAIEEECEDEEEFEVASGEIDDDAISYSSVKHVLKHELYFQREVQERKTPACLVMFSPEYFFSEATDYERWTEIIEASDSPFTFNKLVLRERVMEMCKEEYRQMILDKYFSIGEQDTSTILNVFQGLLIVVVMDTQMRPWTCRVVSRKDTLPTPTNQVEYLRVLMNRDSEEELARWIHLYRIDMEVYGRIPVIIAKVEPLTSRHANEMTSFVIDEDVREDWFMIRRDEGVLALDTMIRMPPVPKESLPTYKVIFKPIYDEWYETWKFENKRNNFRTVLKRKYDPVREYMHKSRMIVNYAHQYYRMKRFDSLMARDPTEYQMIDRSDVPSASLFDSLDMAVSKFCNEDSPHLSPEDRQMVKDTLIQLATGKIPHFTTNYFEGEDYTATSETKNTNAEDNETDKSPLLKAADEAPTVTSHAKYLELENCQEEMKWLRSLFEDQDMHRRRFMAVVLFEIAQKAMFRFAPNLANFERARKKFDHLLTLHGKQRPLLDMMITKVRGTYFMSNEANKFLYDMKLITFGELADARIHPKHWMLKKESLKKHRRRYPKSLTGGYPERPEAEEVSESGSEIKSDKSSSIGSQDSLNTVNSRISWKMRGKQGKKAYSKKQRELMLLKMRSRPDNPDDRFKAEKRALGPKGWKTRRRLNDALEGIADLDKRKLAKKMPSKKKNLLGYVNDLIINNSDTAHWTWGELKMQTRKGKIPPVHRMKSKHVAKVLSGSKMYKPPKELDKNSPDYEKNWF